MILAIHNPDRALEGLRSHFTVSPFGSHASGAQIDPQRLAVHPLPGGQQRIAQMRVDPISLEPGGGAEKHAAAFQSITANEAKPVLIS